jgi:hypothetical protein
LPPRKRPARGTYAEDSDIPDPIPPSETIQPAINDPYQHKLYVGKSEDPPDAGWGLFASRSIPGDSIICEYKGRIDAPPLSPPSSYVFTLKYKDGSTHTIDAYDPVLKRVLSLGGFSNDPLDERRENAKWLIKGNRLYLQATRDIKPHEQIFVHYGAQYWANDSFDLPLMILAVERYITSIDLSHPIWYHLRLTPLLWYYLYGPNAPFPNRPSPVGHQDDPCPRVPPLPQRLRNRSLQTLLTDMRTEGSMPLGEALPSDASITAFCRRRGIANRFSTNTSVSPDRPSLPASPLIGTSRRALLLATDIAGIPCVPDLEGVLLASSNRSPPVSPVIDMSAYDLLLPVSSMPSMPPVVSTGDSADSQPAPSRGSRPALPDCIYSLDFDKRVHNS